jgi:hypothetical protein
MRTLKWWGASALGVVSTTLIAPAHAAQISRSGGDGNAIITIVGEIEHGDDDAFRALTAHVRHGLVVLDGPGGLLAPALTIGDAVHSKGFETAVAGQCASACAMIWLAGSKRFITPVSRVGFHSARVKGKENDNIPSPQGNALTQAYVVRIGLGADMARLVIYASPNRMMWLGPREMRRIELPVTVIGEPAETAEVVK